MSTVPFACPILALIVVVEPVLSDSSPIRLVMLILLIPPIPADSDRPLATDVLLRLLSNFILSAHISPAYEIVYGRRYNTVNVDNRSTDCSVTA